MSLFRNLVLIDVGRTKRPKVNTPDGMSIRIFANGEVYPSKDLVEKFNLEYRNKSTEENLVDQGFGFDVVDSSEWEPTKAFPRNILLGLVSKTKPKVDLFADTRYTTDGQPKATVLSQGLVSATLLDLVRSLGYLSANQKYCDLVVDVDNPINTKDGLSFVPKTIERGVDKGQKTTQRRENSVYFLATLPEAPAVEPVAAISSNQQTITNQ